MSSTISNGFINKTNLQEFQNMEIEEMKFSNQKYTKEKQRNIGRNNVTETLQSTKGDAATAAL